MQTNSGYKQTCINIAVTKTENNWLYIFLNGIIKKFASTKLLFIDYLTLWGIWECILIIGESFWTMLWL